MQLTRADKWLIGILIVAAVGGIALNIAVSYVARPQKAEIYQEGHLVKVINLRPGYHEEVRLGGVVHFNVVVADNGRIRMAEADCPDQVCVHTGWISQPPQQIVCLPYRVVIRLEPAANADIDDITR